MVQIRSHYRLASAVLGISLFTLNLASAKLPAWSYDPGPNPNPSNTNSEMEKELIDLTARIANAPELSEQIVGRQRFRPAYGPIPWRMLLKKNSVKILFIGQDGTHIAEAANRPATAGFGGRAQDLAAYFGVNEGAAFINTYAFTINGQYNTANTPYLDRTNRNNKIFTSTLTDNNFWLVSQDQSSPVTQWRNDLIDWIIRNNPDSLQLIVAFGGAAKDGISSFVISRGGDAKGRLENKMNVIQVAETKIVGAGSNKQFAQLIDKDANDDRRNDLYQNFENERARREGRRAVSYDYSKPEDQTAVLKDLKDNLPAYLPRMAFTAGGPKKNGILEAAQLGGYDMEKLSVNGEETISIKGLEMIERRTVNGVEVTKKVPVTRDVLVVQLPHPTALSMMTPDDASATVKERLKILESKAKTPSNPNGTWLIPNDEGMVNKFAAGEDYQYARSDIGPEYYDFGTPASRMVSVSSASRMSGGGNSHIIVFGSRDRGDFPKTTLATMTNFKAGKPYTPSQAIDGSKDFLTTRPRSESMRYVYDSGPNVLNADGSVKINYAQIMKSELIKAQDKIYKIKNSDVVWDKEKRAHQEMPIANFNIKSHPMIADFGHYRGTFKNPKVIVLADPDGYDDMITSRALTGERGQYLQGLMTDIGVPTQYLVIKTVPYGMDGATQEEWDATLASTKAYREAVFSTLLKNIEKPQLVITDGPIAAKEIKSLLGDLQVPVVNIDRSAGTGKDAGIVDAAKKIADPAHPLLAAAAGKPISGDRINIPREHLPYYSRIWEGTSGDRVLNSAPGSELEGIAFAEVAPKWAFEKNFALTAKEEDLKNELLDKLDRAKLPRPDEKLPAFKQRVGGDLSLPELPGA